MCSIWATAFIRKIDPEHVKVMIDTVHELSRQYHSAA